MSLCINPHCAQPDHPDNLQAITCQNCGAPLVLQGRYRVMAIVSQNTGFGTVYEAYERQQAKILKVLRPERAADSKVLDMFVQEATMLSQIRHGGVPDVGPEGYFTVAMPGSQAPLHCLVMEKIDGLNLRQWMIQQGNHPISEGQALHWLMQLTDILQRIHQQNYFHRDIKPDNVMVRANGQLVLVDFGAAREMTHTYLAQLASQGGITRVSSAGYTPPEQEQGQAVPQSDFYALGRTMIYLLTARSPNDAALYDPLRNHFEWRPLAPQVSPAFADILDRLIAPRVVDRPPSAQSILDALQGLARDRWWATNADLGGSTTHLPETTLTPATTQKSTTRPPSSAPPSRRGMLTGLRPSWLLARPLALGLGFFVLVSLGWGSWQVAQRQGWLLPAAQTLAAPQYDLRGHRSSINTLRLLVDGRRLVSAGADRQLHLWDLATGALLQTWPQTPSFINALAISPDGTWIYVAQADGTLEAWPLGRTVTAPAWRQTVGAGVALNALTLTPDGQRLIAGAANGLIHVVGVQNGTTLLSRSLHSGAINGVAISADGQTVVTGGSDRAVRVWNLATDPDPITLGSHDSFVNHVLISPDGQTVYSAGADGTIRQWDLLGRDRPLLRILRGHRSYVNVLAISPDGRTLLSGGADGVVYLWDGASGRLQRHLRGFSLPVDSLVLTPTQQLVTASRTAPTLRVWTLPSP